MTPERENLIMKIPYEPQPCHGPQNQPLGQVRAGAPGFVRVNMVVLVIVLAQ